MIVNPATLGPIATRVVDGIEALDFDPDVACEGRQCTHPADVWITTVCRCQVNPACESCLASDLATDFAAQCVTCGREYPTAREAIVILGPVKP